MPLDCNTFLLYFVYEMFVELSGGEIKEGNDGCS
jgi:hypothetical protein